MTSQIAGPAIAVRLLVAATVLMGWVVAIQQLLEDGWIAGGGSNRVDTRFVWPLR